MSSLKKLLSKFPYFLDKSMGSNFFKSENVFNNAFKILRDDLFRVYCSDKLDESLSLWREQDEAYSYRMFFRVDLPYIKRVKVLENDGVIYSESYDYDEFKDSFNYIHEATTETVIPTSKFKLTVETYDEKCLSKGFPENDTPIGDDYDHNKSLDEIGELINLPRRTYKQTDDYLNTEPPYNNQSTEDDHHYTNRIKEYLNHIHDTPLQVLEIWKALSIPLEHIKLVNREHLLCKMSNKNNGTQQLLGEHHDTMCNGEEEQPLLFAEVNNNTPVQLQNFRFHFTILNTLGKPITGEYYYIVPFVDGQIIDTILHSNQTWTLNTSFINHETGRFQFKLFKYLTDAENEKYKANGLLTIDENDVVSEEILITTRGCNSADWYVNPEGEDTNNGMTKNTPFQTLSKALSMVEADRNIISLSEGEHIIEGNTPIIESAKIISCPNTYTVIKNIGSDKCFKINKEKYLYLQNIHLNYSLHTVLVEDMTFTNNNIDNSPLNVTVDVIELITEGDNITFTDTPKNRDNITIDTTNNKENGKWEIIISPELYKSDKIIVQEDSTNPNTIIKDKE